MPGRDQFDVFLSCAGPDRPAVRVLKKAMESAGLRVFLDERSIEYFQPITREIELGLRSSKVLLAYYSRSYAGRPACQQELTAAFLAGRREGDPMRRIVVVNPEDPDSGHLLPAQLADAKYAVLPATGTDLRHLVRRIKERTDRLAGTMGDIELRPDRAWYGRVAGSVGFVGRYREQWLLHTALTDAAFPLTRDATGAPVASLVGMSGIGKTELAAAYAWNFGAEYADGRVCWLDLDGAGPADVLVRYEDAVRTLAETMRLDPGDIGRDRLFGLVAEHLGGLAGPSLWVIDNLPTGLAAGTVRQLILPGGPKVRTLLTTHADDYRWVATTVPLGPLPDADAGFLLGQFREPADEEQVAFERLVHQLGGHPLVLRLAGNALRGREDLVSFSQYGDRLATEPDTVAIVADLLERPIIELGEAARLVLHLGRVCAPTGLPARFVGTVVERLLPGEGPDPAGTALVTLQDLALAQGEDARWRIHALVLDAARRHLGPPPPDLVRTAADVLDELEGGSELTPADRSDVVRHLEALAPGLPAERATRTLSRVALYYEGRGEPVLAASPRDRIVDLDPSSADALAAAAATHLAAGDYETARDQSRQAMQLGSTDPATLHRARRTVAEALDALGLYADAEVEWEILLGTTPADDPLEDLRTRIARLRSLRLRGRMTEVKATGPAVIADADALSAAGLPEAFDLAQAGELDLARAEVLTDGQRVARERAAAVVERYRERGLPDHARSLEAQEVLAEAWLTMHLWELNPDEDYWVKAQDRLEELWETNRRTYGENNPITLATAVDHTYALVSQGHREQGRERLDALVPTLARRLGTQHPLHSRAIFLRGLIHAQLQEHDRARPLFEEALRGQRATLGAGHAHTLRTQYELAVALKLAGDDGWLPLMRQVKDLARGAVGRENDLYAQATLALGLLRLPAPLVRLVSRWGRPTPDSGDPAARPPRAGRRAS